MNFRLILNIMGYTLWVEAVFGSAAAAAGVRRLW